MKKIIFYTFFVALFVITNSVYSQCKVENTYFKEGEFLQYDMYAKVGFTTVRAGEIMLSVNKNDTEYPGDYKIEFQTITTGIVNTFYPIIDTLYSYMTKDVVPMVYIKHASEGGDYTNEVLNYTYQPDGKINLHVIRHKNGDFKFDENIVSDSCTYDLVSIVYYARTLDYDSLKPKDQIATKFISGKKLDELDLIYIGKSAIKANDGKKYNCIQLQINFTARGAAKSKEMMKVYLTDDLNRIPIQIETKLNNIGTAKGVLSSAKGLANQ